MSREVCDHLWELDNPTPCPECDAEFKAYMVDFEKIVKNRQNLRTEHTRYREALEVIANYPCVALTQDLKHAKLIAREALNPTK